MMLLGMINVFVGQFDMLKLLKTHFALSLCFKVEFLILYRFVAINQSLLRLTKAIPGCVNDDIHKQPLH